MGVWFSQIWPEKPNPSLVEIEARQRAEAEAKQARIDVEIAHKKVTAMVRAERVANEDRLKAATAAHAANKEAKQRAAEVEKGKKQAAALQEQIKQDAQAARERTKQLEEAVKEEKRKADAAKEASSAQAQAHKDMMVVIQAERAANEARLKAEAAAHAADEEAKQRATEVEEERRKAAAIQKQIKQEVQAAQEHTKKLEEAVKKEKRKADAVEEAAIESKKAAEEKFRRADVARQEAESKLSKGIQPLVTPTPDEVRDNKLLAQYCEDRFHVAVAGMAGGGKSSLINAFRGLRNIDIGAAATGTNETTTDITRCPDPNAEYPYVWYDVPGAGTLEIPHWQYFNVQGLYIYDCIIVLFNDRFTEIDIAILNNCRHFEIPAYIVRSKADQHIRNIIKDMGYDSDDNESEDQEKLYQAARQQFIQQTRQSVENNLEKAKIPNKRVYIVSNKTMFGVVTGRRPKAVIDEIELLNDLIWTTQTRRQGRSEARVATVVKNVMQSLTGS
ncbi:interferon-inducible GTPase-domain-containing protein [Suillus bovinus]|uniref:interferon-inducible GTPase-domain-containing protein n=1 Tax=Suillus bovinus TaxID=48563 RepID=UPI001B86FD80|nr:interferon-inducible GTPase-domain-containing protein [Suillus bovinus]KAG2135746.1 interferon-inducible GTPase-domain-containing protein [Suillus bovinus]